MIFGETKVMILKDYPFIDMITKNISNLKNTEGTVVGITSEGYYVVFPDNGSVDCIYCERNEIMTLKECYRKMNKLEKLRKNCRYYVEGDKDCGPSCKLDRKFIEQNNWSCNNCNKYKSSDLTNQDYVAEKIFGAMDPEALAEILENNVFVCDHNCPIQKANSGKVCPEGVFCRVAITEWLKKPYKED